MSATERTRRLKPGLDAALQLVLPFFGRRTDPVEADRAAGPAAGERWRETRGKQATIHYLFRRRARKTIGFTIDRRGLVVSAPRTVTLAEVDAAVREKETWIRKKLGEWQAFEARLQKLQTEWCAGGLVRFLGNDLRLTLGNSGRTSALNRDRSPWTLDLALAPDAQAARIQRAAERWLKREAQTVLGERLAHYSARLGRVPRDWQLSSARTLWGSCTHEGVIRLNWRLVHLPLHLIDYVVAHECAHLRELNHSPRFWKTVAQIMPEWEAARRELANMPEHLAL